MHVGIAYPRWRGKRSRHSRRMRTHSFTYLARGPCIMFWYIVWKYWFRHFIAEVLNVPRSVNKGQSQYHLFFVPKMHYHCFDTCTFMWLTANYGTGIIIQSWAVVGRKWYVNFGSNFVTAAASLTIVCWNNRNGLFPFPLCTMAYAKFSRNCFYITKM